MHTEEQARKLWCPMARVVFVDGNVKQIGTGNRGAVDPGCIASDCAMWVWASLKVTPEYLDAVRTLADSRKEKAPFAKAAREVADNPEKYGLPSKPFMGSCGLIRR